MAQGKTYWPFRILFLPPDGKWWLQKTVENEIIHFLSRGQLVPIIEIIEEGI